MAKKAEKPVKTAEQKKAEKIKELTTVLNEKATATKATWTGTLTFGLMAIPTKSYKATDVDSVELNQLHDSCQSKLNRKMFCATCQVDVDQTHIILGHQFAEGQFVTVTEEEKKKLTLDPEGKKLEILNFVPVDQIDPIYFESTDYLAPDAGGELPFALLRAAMLERKVFAIGHRVKAGRDQHFAIRPFGENGLALSYLFYEHEIRNFEKWPAIAIKASDEKTGKMLKAASALVDSLTEDFTLDGVSDTYNTSLKQLIASKIPDSGVPAPKLTPAEEAAAPTDLLAALQASLAATSKKSRRVVA